MTDLPDLHPFCEAVAIKLWGEPHHRTHKQLRWSGGNGYGGRMLDPRKGTWYDREAQRGGSTLELLAYSKGIANEDIRDRVYWDLRRALDELEVGAPRTPEKKKKKDEWPPIRATFPYTDENNVLLFEQVRFDTTNRDDRFRPRRPDGKGGWIWDLKHVRRVLYRLPELIGAVKAGERVLVCEGEKDAETAVKLGYAATTMPGGVGKWVKEYDEFFRGADVVVVSDNDPQLKDPKTSELKFHPDGAPVLPGQDHAAKVAKRLAKVAAQVRVIMFEVKDFTEWVAAGGTREQCDVLIEAAPEQVKQPSPEEASEQEPEEEEPIDPDVEIERLMGLSDLEYEQQKKGVAKKLGVGVSYLDRLRRAEQAQDDDGKQGREIEFPEPQVWPDHVDGAVLLDAIASAVCSHIIMPEHCRDTCALWIVHAFLVDRFPVSPRLGVTSPVKGCGKSTLLDVISRLVPRPLLSENVTPASIFRVVEPYRPTLLIDEVDSFLHGEHADELRGILNGNRQGSIVLRVVGDEHEVRAFSVYTAVALGLIGNLPDTLADRAVPIELRRRRPNEAITPYRPDRADHLVELARKAARWGHDHADRVAELEPKMPAGLINRTADNWRPLLAIADEAGGTWPERARTAAQTSCNSASDRVSRLELLLSDIRDIFGRRPLTTDLFGKEDREISSAGLVKVLLAIEGRPWAEMGEQSKPLTPNQLARMLKPLAIAPNKVGPRDACVNGYKLSQFREAFESYLFTPGHTTTGVRGGLQPDTWTQCSKYGHF